MSIAQRAVHGAAWAIVTGLGARALGLAGTLLIVRYLAPAEYGEVSGAFIVVATVNQFSTLGTGMYVFANPNASRDELFHATVLHMTIGVAALGLMVLLSVPIGRLLAMPMLELFVPGLVVAALFDRAVVMPERILLRDLRFPYVSAVRAVGDVAYTVVSLALAVTGWGAASIVYGNIARSLLRLACVGAAVERREWLQPCPMKRDTFGQMIRYGWTVSIGSLALFASRRWDNLLMARMFGPATMGAYNIAYNLADMPAAQVGEQVTDVLLASFSRLGLARRATALIRTCTMLGLIMFPLAIGLGAVAPAIGRAFFKPEWKDVAPMLMLLSILSVPRPIGGALTAYLHSVNRPMTVLWLEWCNVGMLLTTMAILGIFGPLWACAAVGIAFTVRALAAMLIVGRAEGIGVQNFVGGLVRPLLACVPMLAAVLVLDRQSRLHYRDHPVLLLAAECVVGALVYGLSALVFARQATLELLRLSRSALRGARHGEPVSAAGLP